VARWADLRYGLTLYAGPTDEPLSYGQVKSQIQASSNDHEALIAELIVSARQTVEQDTGLRLLSQTWDLTLDAFPDDAIELPIGPLQSVTSITVTPVTGAAAVVASTNYIVDTANGRIVLADTGTWPGDIRIAAGIVVRCVLGYATTALVPAPLVDAMRELVASRYAARVGSQYVPPPRWLGYDSKIAPYRRPGIA
jgi:uncharacterized phiE125 gp8 family phage protein